VSKAKEKVERCSNCLYFSGTSGQCYRFPPTVTTVHVVYVGTYPFSDSPKVAPTAWCGEWKKNG
jgi:hypothetical protein